MCFLWVENGTPTTNGIGQHVDNKINKMHEPKYTKYMLYVWIYEKGVEKFKVAP